MPPSGHQGSGQGRARLARPGRSTTASATPSRSISPSSLPRLPSAAGSKHRQAGQSGNSSRQPAATASSRSRPDGKPSPLPTPSPTTSARPSKPLPAAAEVRTSLSQLGFRGSEVPAARLYRVGAPGSVAVRRLANPVTLCDGDGVFLVAASAQFRDGRRQSTAAGTGLSSTSVPI